MVIENASNKNNSKYSFWFSRIIVLFGAMVLAIGIGGGFFLGFKAGQTVHPNQMASPTPFQVSLPSVTPTLIPISPTDDPVQTTWKTYINKKAGYSIKFPPEWIVTVKEIDPLPTGADYVTSLQAYPSQSPFGTQDPNAISVDIAYPISEKGPHYDIGKLYELGLKGLEHYSHWGSSAVLYSFYVKVDNRPTLTVKAVSPATPVAGFGGDWCNHCSNKYYYIELDDRSILTIEAFWGKNQISFEPIFDKIVNTFHIVSY